MQELQGGKVALRLGDLEPDTRRIGSMAMQVPGAWGLEWGPLLPASVAGQPGSLRNVIFTV